MRISISFDGAGTEEVRRLAVALHRAHLTSTLQVGCDGPEKWNGSTPKLTPSQWSTVAAELLTVDGVTVADRYRAEHGIPS